MIPRSRAIVLSVALAAACEGADVGQEPDAGAPDAGADALLLDGAMPLDDGGDRDAAALAVLFEDRFDGEGAASRWDTTATGAQLVFADDVVTSPTSCDVFGECPEGPAVAHSRAVIEVPEDERITLEFDFALAQNANDYFRTSVLVSLGVDGTVPRLEMPCAGGTEPRCWRDFEFFVIAQIRFPGSATVSGEVVDGVMPIDRAYEPERHLRDGQWYSARVSLCALDGARFQITDGARPIIDQRDRAFVIRLRGPGWERQNVYIEGQGPGHQIDNVRVLAGGDCD